MTRYGSFRRMKQKAPDTNQYRKPSAQNVPHPTEWITKDICVLRHRDFPINRRLETLFIIVQTLTINVCTNAATCPSAATSSKYENLDLSSKDLHICNLSIRHLVATNFGKLRLQKNAQTY